MITAFETTKTEAGMRNIPVSPEVEDCFRALEENRRDVPLSMTERRSRYGKKQLLRKESFAVTEESSRKPEQPK